MTRKADMSWVHQPKQKRSQETQGRLLDALESIFNDGGGLEQVSVAEVARRAEVSVGAFYARFKNREAALYAMHERFCIEAKATADIALTPARWEGVPMQQVVTSIVGFLAAEYAARAGLRRAIVLLNATDDDARARSKQVSGYVASRIHGLFAAHAKEIAHDDLMLAADVVHRTLFSMLDQWAIFRDGSSTGRTIDSEIWLRELTRVVGSYLGIRSA